MTPKINIEKKDAPKVVASYRIDPELLELADHACRQQYGVGVASFIEPMLKKHFKLKKANETDGKSSDNS